MDNNKHIEVDLVISFGEFSKIYYKPYKIILDLLLLTLGIGFSIFYMINQTEKSVGILVFQIILCLIFYLPLLISTYNFLDDWLMLAVRDCRFVCSSKEFSLTSVNYSETFSWDELDNIEENKNSKHTTVGE